MRNTNLLIGARKAERVEMDIQCAGDLLDIIEKLEKGKDLTDEETIILLNYDIRSRDKSIHVE